MTISTLIDKQDNAEIIRDQVAAILAIESAAQVALATTAGKPDPSLWGLRVYQERANPWESFPSHENDTTPIVNVWWDSSSFDKAGSNVVERQKSTITVNVDCYGYGKSQDDGATGHVPGDRQAAEAAQRAVRLVRNILMAAEYTYLELRGTVWQRWVENISMFQPQQDNRQAEHIVAARVSFAVQFSEYSPQVVGQPLELLSAQVSKDVDGQIVINADYDYTV